MLILLCYVNPAGIYLLKVNNRNALFKYISDFVLVLLLLSLNMQLPAGNVI